MIPLQEATIQFLSSNHAPESHEHSNRVEGRWNHQEHLKFLNAIIHYGKDWKKVEEVVSFRTGAQVRSHAQKYFLKINKIIKDRKKIKGKKMPDITETELELKQYFTCNSLTSQTPKEIIELLKIQKVGIKEIIEQNCNGQQKMRIQQLLTPTIKSDKKKTAKVNVVKSVPKEYAAIENELNELCEDSSFLLGVIRKHMDFFSNGGNISAFIDYGFSHKKQRVAIEDQQTTGLRKSSFTQFDGWIIEQ